MKPFNCLRISVVFMLAVSFLVLQIPFPTSAQETDNYERAKTLMGKGKYKKARKQFHKALKEAAEDRREEIKAKIALAHSKHRQTKAKKQLQEDENEKARRNYVVALSFAKKAGTESNADNQSRIEAQIALVNVKKTTPSILQALETAKTKYFRDGAVALKTRSHTQKHKKIEVDGFSVRDSLPITSIESGAVYAWAQGFAGKGVKVGLGDEEDVEGVTNHFVIKAVAPEADISQQYDTSQTGGSEYMKRLFILMKTFEASGHHIYFFQSSGHRTIFHNNESWNERFAKEVRYAAKFMLPSKILDDDDSLIQNPKAFNKNMLLILPSEEVGSSCEAIINSRELKDCNMAGRSLVTYRTQGIDAVAGQEAVRAPICDTGYTLRPSGQGVSCLNDAGEGGGASGGVILRQGRCVGLPASAAYDRFRDSKSLCSFIIQSGQLAGVSWEPIIFQTPQKAIAAQEGFAADTDAGDRVLFVGDVDGISRILRPGETFKNDFIVTKSRVYAGRVTAGSVTDTSSSIYAAARVVGAAALIRQKFPNLDGAGLKKVLIQTADDLGATGADPIYGRGRLNLLNALSPQGRVTPQ